MTTLFLLEAKLLTWRLQDQFSKSCSPLGYNGYFCCQNAVLPGRQRFPGTPRRLPGDSPPTPRGLPGDYPRHPPTRSLGDMYTLENQCVYCNVATGTPRTTLSTPRSFQIYPLYVLRIAHCSFRFCKLLFLVTTVFRYRLDWFRLGNIGVVSHVRFFYSALSVPSLNPV